MWCNAKLNVFECDMSDQTAKKKTVSSEMQDAKWCLCISSWQRFWRRPHLVATGNVRSSRVARRRYQGFQWKISFSSFVCLHVGDSSELRRRLLFNHWYSRTQALIHFAMTPAWSQCRPATDKQLFSKCYKWATVHMAEWIPCRNG